MVSPGNDCPDRPLDSDVTCVTVDELSGQDISESGVTFRVRAVSRQGKPSKTWSMSGKYSSVSGFTLVSIAPWFLDTLRIDFSTDF